MYRYMMINDFIFHGVGQGLFYVGSIDNKNYKPFILLAKDIYQTNGKVRTLLDRFKDCPSFSFDYPAFCPCRDFNESECQKIYGQRKQESDRQGNL